MAFDVTPIVDAMTQTNTVMDAAIVFIDSTPGLIQQAIDAALLNGATGPQLQPVTDAVAALTAKRDALVAALAANTPTPPSPPAPPNPVMAKFRK